MRRTSGEKKVSGGMVRRLASNLYHADRRRNITAIAAIALSSMLIIMALSAILSIEAAMRRSRQMLIGTKAEGVYTFLSYNWFEALRDSGHFDAMSMVFHLGWYETASATGDEHRIYSTDAETASWNFNELLRQLGRKCERDRGGCAFCTGERRRGQGGRHLSYHSKNGTS